MDVSAFREALAKITKKLVAVRTGTVVSNLAPLGQTMVHLDNDDSGTPVSAQALDHPYAAGTRVSLLSNPTFGLLIVGPLSTYVDPAITALQVATADSGWIAPTLLNSWANFGSGWTDAGYRKVGDRVYLRGLVHSGTNTAAIFTLPVGYRPTSGHIMFAGITSSTPVSGSSGPASAGTAHTHTAGGYVTGNAGTRIDVLTDGSVYKPDGNNSFVGLWGSFSVT